MNTSPHPISADPVAGFQKLFMTVARYRHRHEVFRDFVAAFAISLHNGAGAPSPALEREYHEIMTRYERADCERFSTLAAFVITALQPEPRDILGPIFMGLDLGNNWRGQFFTPHGISKMMAAIAQGNITETIKGGGLVSISEPACGAGGMILAAAGRVIEAGFDPAKTMRVHAVDTDRTAALMCYIQCALWNIPTTVVVGDSLTLEVRETWLTPALRNPIFRMGLQA